ncbi:hypothetical protein QRO24_02285 [Gallibacterium anatis]|uniref:hypothetical protein n=1 Tax=Gallibacterium anatis TaxID=750 RepID=UPI0038B3C310
MKILLTFLLSTFLSGCYLANGPPSSYNYWIKNGRKVSVEDRDKCYLLAIKSLNISERKEFYYLNNKFNENPINMINNHKSDYEKYSFLIKKVGQQSNQCYYDLGYRFIPPLTWCLVQNGDSANICIENMKYRF